MYRAIYTIPLLLGLLCGNAVAAEDAATSAASGYKAPVEVQERFNRRYQDYLRADSQMLLPFPKMEPQEWNKVRESRPLRKIYTEPDKYYNNKVYSFTLYQAADDGTYFLDAKGGFWGMDELFYGPITEQELR